METWKRVLSKTAGQLDHLALGTTKTDLFHDEGIRILSDMASPRCDRANLQVRSRIALRAPWAYRLFMSNPHPHTSDSPLRVVVSLDVEEEGLFSGHYATSGCGVSNVSLLPRLAPLSRDLGFPLTLFCAHTVFADAGACRVLEQMRDHYGAEIGAHLHHWSTPPASPLDPPHEGQPTRTDKLPRDLLRQRLATLLDAGREFQGAPLTSFRMGRWDLKDCVRPLLSEAGIKVDSSVCLLRHFPGGPDHFLAPADPYWVEGWQGAPLLEAPITQIPLHPALAQLWYRACPAASRDKFHFWGVLSPNPFWHAPRIMRWAARLVIAGRGGQVLSLFWHSSEMLPGGSPHVPDQKAADAVLERIYAFLSWLRETFPVQGCTASQLAELPAGTFPCPPGRPGRLVKREPNGQPGPVLLPDAVGTDTAFFSWLHLTEE